MISLASTYVDMFCGEAQLVKRLNSMLEVPSSSNLEGEKKNISEYFRAALSLMVKAEKVLAKFILLAFKGYLSEPIRV